MKLGKLNAAIDATPTVYFQTKLGLVAVQKGSLKQALKDTFNGERAVETGYMVDSEGKFGGDPEVARDS